MTLDNVYDVRFSREASVRHGNGEIYNAFALNTYIARVEFDDGRDVIVVCPRMAASNPESRWVPKVLKWAIIAREESLNVMLMPGVST